jgi:hypothetical protein
MVYVDVLYCSNLENYDPYNYINQFALMNIGQIELLSEPNEYLHYQLIIKNGRTVTGYLQDLINFVLVDIFRFLATNNYDELFVQACKIGF